LTAPTASRSSAEMPIAWSWITYATATCRLRVDSHALRTANCLTGATLLIVFSCGYAHLLITIVTVIRFLVVPQVPFRLKHQQKSGCACLA
jgi:hypothetical protein